MIYVNYRDIKYLLLPIPIVSVSGVVTSNASTASDGPLQQDGGDIGASVIENLPDSVSAQCELNIKYIMYVCPCNTVQ